MSQNSINVIICLLILRNVIGSTNDIDVGDESGRLFRQTITDEMLEAVLDPGPLVKYGFFCRRLPIEITGSEVSEVTTAPVKYTIYYIDDTTPNTLHIVLESVNVAYRFDYLVVMVLNQDGVPVGHFHLLVCDQDGAKRSGEWMLGFRCNKGKDPGGILRQKHGNPHLMYVRRDPTSTERLSIQSIFWSWIPRDSIKRPTMIQFRIAVVEKAQSRGRDKFWIIITPQLRFLNVWKFTTSLASEGLADLDNPMSDDKENPEKCYDNPLMIDSPGNFQSTVIMNEIAPDQAFLSELFPVWFNNPSAEKRNQRLKQLKAEMRKEIKRKDFKKEESNFMLPPSMGSVILTTKDHKEIYTGCSVVKNCLGDTENCVALKNCKFLVTYRNTEYTFGSEDYIRFELQAHLSQDYGYAAVGISQDRSMGDDNVVECSVDQSGVSGVYGSWNFHKTNTRAGASCEKEGVRDENLKNCKLALRSKVLACSFYLRKHLFLPEHVKLSRKVFHLANNKFYLLRASGSTFVTGTHNVSLWSPKTQRKEEHQRKAALKKSQSSHKKNKRDKRELQNDGTVSKRGVKHTGKAGARSLSFHKNTNHKAGKTASTGTSGIGKHNQQYASDKQWNLKELEEIEQSPKLKYIKWHVAIVVIAFIALVPNGVFVARYFKETWTAAMIFNVSIWRLVHGAYMVSVMLLLLADFCILLTYPTNTSKDAGFTTHRICGYLFYVVVIVIQPLIGLSTSYTKGTLLYIAQVSHWGIGTLVKVLANILISFSPQMIETRIFIGIWVICFLELLFNITMHAIMTVLYHLNDKEVFKARKNSHGMWNRAFNPLPMAKIHKALPGERRRFLLYLWYQFGTAVFASLIIIPYAGYNALFVCKDEPLALHRVICQNPGKYHT